MRSLHILLAEDNVVNQKLALKLLEKRGHHVVLANNGREALTAFGTAAFDLIMMDVQMPEMDGLEATREIRNREAISGSHTPIVAMTALAMKGDKERCLAGGMDDYLSKPIRPQELDATLDHYMSAKSLITATLTERQEPVLDEAELLDRVNDDREFLAELADIFRDDYPKQLANAKQALADGNTAVISAIGHALKGTLANLAAHYASTVAGTMETAGKGGELAEVRMLLKELERSLVDVDRALGTLTENATAVLEEVAA